MTADAPPPAPKAVVFDIGEVIIDETRVWSTWAGLVGVSPFTLHAVLGAAIVDGLDHEAAFAEVAPNLDWRELEAAHEERYGGFGPDDIYPDVRPCLADLRAAGFRTALSGNQPARRDDQLAALDLGTDHIATSAALGVDKPSPGYFTAVAERLALAPHELLYVGDRVDNDVLPALEAGWRACWLRRGPWGHLQELPDDTEPDLVLSGLGELPTLLGAWRDEAEQ